MIHISSTNSIYLIGVFFLVFFLSKILFDLFRPGLRELQGPWLAKLSPLWRTWLVSKGNAHEDYRELHKRYGPIVRTAPNAVDISDPTVIPQIYGIGSRFYKSQFYDSFAVLYQGQSMHSMFSTRDPEEHNTLKRSVAQKFAMTSIRSLEYLVDPCNSLFMDSMMDLQGQVVDLGVWVQWYAFDAIGAITFSRMFGFMEQREDVNGIINGIENGLCYGAIVGQMPWIHKMLLGNLRMRRILSFLTGNQADPIPVVTKMVMDSLKEYDLSNEDSSARSDFLAYLREPRKSAEKHISDRDLINHLMNNLLAGSDTTGISLRAIFYYILQDKEAYCRLQKEIDEAFVGGKLSTTVTYSESLQLPYLQACIKEAMRMHPGVSLPLERIVPLGGTKLCGTYLPAGTVVGVNAAVIHRDRTIFGEDADDFRPERWLKDGQESARRMERYLLTFGAGSRTCIGKNISLMEMGKLVPQVLRKFSLEWASDEPYWQVKTYWFAKQTGLLVRFKPRDSLT